MARIIGIDFFCGVGGATKGFQNSGINVVRGIDNDLNCKETYETNCSPSKFLLADINDLNPEEVLRGIPRSGRDYIFFIACAPCQPFSRIAKNSKADPHLVLKFGEFVEQLRPHIIFMENVLGLAQVNEGLILKRFTHILEDEELGYDYEWRPVDAKYYGVPQRRSRFIMLASRIGKIPFPTETHGGKLLPFATVREAISKYPPIAAGETHGEVPNHSARALSKLNLKRMRKTPKDGGSRKDWPRNLWLRCHKKSSGHSDVYGRMKWNEPAPTLTCKCNSITNGRFGHPEQDRGISLREAAAIQTFSDDFIFYAENTTIAKHIGNAVPPMLAEVFGRKIVAYSGQSR